MTGVRMRSLGFYFNSTAECMTERLLLGPTLTNFLVLELVDYIDMSFVSMGTPRNSVSCILAIPLFKLREV